MTATLTAQELFREAYENRYTWDESFPGIVATVSISINGDRRTGKATIASDLSVTVTMDEPQPTTRTSTAPDGTTKTVTVDIGQEWLTNQLRDVVTHRKRKSFAEAHGKSTFQLGQTDDTGAYEILVSGDSMGSNYKVRDRQIVFVSRVMGRIGFTINHLEKLDTGSGYISSIYNAVFRNPQTNEIVRQTKFQDIYEPINGYYVMTKQIVHSQEQGQTTVYEIEFNDIQFLNP
ncbi:MAG: DUF3386 domain-containing protein [Oscillatoriales cyanobacterium SM2_2_1]|nr:DUF3386 domain-containing protein [Oscillatoriales cyanobacterium SM2_2_1]